MREELYYANTASKTEGCPERGGFTRHGLQGREYDILPVHHVSVVFRIAAIATRLVTSR